MKRYILELLGSFGQLQSTISSSPLLSVNGDTFTLFPVHDYTVEFKNSRYGLRRYFHSKFAIEFGGNWP